MEPSNDYQKTRLVNNQKRIILPLPSKYTTGGAA